MTIIRPEGDAPTCPRCGLVHDPADHDRGHQHDHPLERSATCRAIVSWRGPCACGEPGPHMRFVLGPPWDEYGIVDFILRATGNDDATAAGEGMPIGEGQVPEAVGREAGREIAHQPSRSDARLPLPDVPLVPHRTPEESDR